MTIVQNDKCSEWQVFGMTSVRNDKCSEWQKFCFTNISRENFFAPITPQVFLKHPPGHMESIVILGNKIGPCQGHEKSEQTYKCTHGHPQIIIWICFDQPHRVAASIDLFSYFLAFDSRVIWKFVISGIHSFQIVYIIGEIIFSFILLSNK